jgi:hypothetical protein
MNNNKLVESSQLDTDEGNDGNDFKLHLLEQYKMCVEMADRISTRRSQANSFYISLLSAPPALLTLVVDKQPFSESRNVLFLFIAIFGLTSCFVWYANIQSYKQLNSAKFNVINEMENFLPFPCFVREWEVLTAEKLKRKEYKQLTSVEKFIPLIFAFPYFGLLVYSSLNILGVIK